MPTARKVIVGTDPVQIVPFNPKRVTLGIFNSGNYTVYVSNDRVGILDKGWPINAGVGVIWKKVDGDHVEYELWGQASDSTEIRVWEDFE